MIDLSTSPFDALPRNAVDALMMCDSYDRPRVLLQQMIREPDRRIRLELFLNFWNMCDAPFPATRFRPFLLCLTNFDRGLVCGAGH